MHLDKIQAIVHQELEQIGTNSKPVQQDELEAIINNWEMAFLWSLEDVLTKAEVVQSYNLHLGDSNYLQQDLERYQQVSADSIQQITANYFTTEKAAVLIVLPEETEEKSP